MFTIEIIIIGLLAIGGVVWQIYLIQQDEERDSPPLRVIIPLAIGGVSIVGLIIHGLIARASSKSRREHTPVCQAEVSFCQRPYFHPADNRINFCYAAI